VDANDLRRKVVDGIDAALNRWRLLRLDPDDRRLLAAQKAMYVERDDVVADLLARFNRTFDDPPPAGEGDGYGPKE
jgi:hypothetical protein